MTDKEALEILRAQGHLAGESDVRTGRVRVWMRDSDEFVDVDSGRELHDFAEGKVTFEELRERREYETLTEA
jgi:hypothetical protein